MNVPHLYYFEPKEFVKGNTAWFDSMDTRLLVLLDSLRHGVGSKFHISKDPGAVGRRAGKSYSQHNINRYKRVRAVDGYFENVDSPKIAKSIVQLATDVGFTGIGVYRGWKSAPYGFHFDTRQDRTPGTPATWGKIKGRNVSITKALESIV